eukprot:53859-Pelagomonas_calceolata.AAC.5
MGGGVAGGSTYPTRGAGGGGGGEAVAGQRVGAATGAAVPNEPARMGASVHTLAHACRSVGVQAKQCGQASVRAQVFKQAAAALTALLINSL